MLMDRRCDYLPIKAYPFLLIVAANVKTSLNTIYKVIKTVKAEYWCRADHWVFYPSQNKVVKMSHYYQFLEPAQLAIEPILQCLIYVLERVICRSKKQFKIESSAVCLPMNATNVRLWM